MTKGKKRIGGASLPEQVRDRSEAGRKAIEEADQLRLDRKEDSLRRALEKYELASRTFELIGKKDSEFTALIKAGEILDSMGEHQEALHHYTKALKLIRGTTDYRRECQVLNKIGIAYSRVGNIQSALSHYRQALELSRKIDDQYEESRALNNLGEAYYDLSDMKVALDYLNQSLRVWRTLGDLPGQAEVLKYLGYVHTDLSELSEALNYYQQALHLYQTTHNAQGEAETTNAIGLVYALLGEREKAIELYSEAEKNFRASGDRHGLITALNGRGAIYTAIGFERALECHNEALRLSTETGDLQGQIVALRYLGTVYRSLGSVRELLAGDQSARQYYTQAVERHKQALALSRLLKDRRIEAYILQDLGSLSDSLGEKAEALNLFKQALLLSKRTEDRRGQAASLNSLGSICDDLGQKQRAFAYFNEALPLTRAAEDPGRESLTLFHLAGIERYWNNLPEARRNIEAAIRITESLRTKVASQDYRAAYLASTRPYYETYIDILMRLHEESPNGGFAATAFQVSEQARARSLLELVKEADFDVREGVDINLLAQERSLERALNGKAERHARLMAARSNDEAAAVAAEINHLTTEYDEVKAQIKTKSPRYAALTQPQPLTLAEIQRQVLDDNSLLLEYILADERSYLWAVSRTEVSSFELPGRAQIENAARHFYKLLTANQPVPGETFEQRHARVAEANAHISEEAASLSKLVLGPVMTKLGNKRLLIVPDGGLQYIPFQALVVPGKANVDDASAQSQTGGSDEQIPLIVDHEIVNEPSASALALVISETAQRKPAPKSIAVLANPVFEADDPRVKSKASAETQVAKLSQETEVKEAFRDAGFGEGLRIPPLPASREEANAIMAMAPWGTGFKAEGFEASRATITRPELGQYRIVHFATHGFVDYEHPELSGLVLSLVDEKGNPQDGFLRMHDIYNLKLPADLVVLSACNTALGKEVKGEGLIGLTRGFMYAGAAGVAASLWKVDDEATAELMKRFYEGMFQKGLTPAAALREAQLGMWRQKRWHAPYYWAAFVIQGQYNQKENLGLGSTPTVKWVAALGSLAAAAGLGVFLLLKRRRRTIL